MTYIDIKCDRRFHVIAISIILFLSVLHFWVTQIDFEEKPLFINLTLISSITMTLFTLVVIFKKYDGARNIRISYLFLFFAYLAYLSGELLWFVYENVLETYPYPGLSDVGFMYYFIFESIFLIATIRCFNTLTRYNIGTVLIIMSIITSVYIVLMIDGETETFDVFFGLAFVLAASSVMGFSVIALTKLRKTSISLAWKLIFISFLITTVADVWYYILENIGVYTYNHIMNTLWITSDMVLVYALILHRRII
jgi:hypothetical protein